MLHGEHGQFWLEPVAVSPEEERERLEDAGAEGRSSAEPHRKSASPLGRPHLVFRRSADQPQLEIGSAAAGRTRRRRKKKRKLERNCGTRGENLPTPSVLYFFLSAPPLLPFHLPSAPFLPPFLTLCSRLSPTDSSLFVSSVPYCALLYVMRLLAASV